MILKQLFRVYFHVTKYIVKQVKTPKNILKSKCYDIDKIIDFLLKYLDKFACYIGPVLIFLVIIIIAWITVIFYLYFIPEILASKDKTLIAFSLFLGHYFLFMLSLLYFKCITISPGRPLNIGNDVNYFQCKKCNNIKPERTHHCSLCKCCVLKMDHHCPWLNKCVGHFNHQFFYLFMLFAMMGCYYVTLNVYPYFLGYIANDFKWIQILIPATFHVKKTFHNLHINKVLNLDYGGSDVTYEMIKESSLYKNMLAIEFLLPFAIGTSLLLLSLWHGFLITRGETSIELHINRDKTRELAKFMKSFPGEQKSEYVNPYNYGYLKNWQIFFGSIDLKQILVNIFIPDLLFLPRRFNPYTRLTRWLQARKLRLCQDGPKLYASKSQQKDYDKHSYTPQNCYVIGDGYNWSTTYIEYFLRYGRPPTRRGLYSNAPLSKPGSPINYSARNGSYDVSSPLNNSPDLPSYGHLVLDMSNENG